MALGPEIASRWAGTGVTAVTVAQAVSDFFFMLHILDLTSRPSQVGDGADPRLH